jgi:HlyD family secretion protein
LTLLVLAALGAGGWYTWHWWTAGPTGPTFRTDKVRTGNLTASITATGTIEPEKVIDVGAQVVGRITQFGVDPRDKNRPIDYCIPVEEGTVLLRLDDALFKAAVDRASAALALAKSNLDKSKASAEQAVRLYQRDLQTGPKALAPSDADIDKAAAETAVAAVSVSEASVKQAEADLATARTNLDYTVIKSPVKGVIIDRRVNIGQTVVAGLQAPSLFLIAQDLHRMQVWAQVNEADVGNIKIGQKATFTVDTYPRDTFEGKVIQVRYNATMTQNVVTYTVVVEVDNPADKDHPDGKLLPYLTTNLRFIVDERKSVLLVPNAALRYHPDLKLIVPSEREQYEQALRGKTMPDENATSTHTKTAHAGSASWVFVEEGAFLRPVRIRIGLTDQRSTEVLEVLSKGADGQPVELKPDTVVVTGEEARAGSVRPASPGGGQKKSDG